MKKYVGKRLSVQLNGNRKVIGVLRGYGVFMNIVLDEAVGEKNGGEKAKLSMVMVCVRFGTLSGESIAVSLLGFLCLS